VETPGERVGSWLGCWRRCCRSRRDAGLGDEAGRGMGDSRAVADDSPALAGRDHYGHTMALVG
jgi:hypothetical protein